MPEAGELLGCTRQWVHQLIREERLPVRVVGGALVLSEDTVLRYREGDPLVDLLGEDAVAEVPPRTGK